MTSTNHQKRWRNTIQFCIFWPNKLRNSIEPSKAVLVFKRYKRNGRKYSVLLPWAGQTEHKLSGSQVFTFASTVLDRNFKKIMD